MRARNSIQLWTLWAINILAIAFLSHLSPLSQSAHAQVEQVPGRGYYSGFFQYYDADYKDAGKIFLRGSDNSAMRFGEQRFLDSICYWTMMGECHFQMGNYPQAVELYEQSLSLYLDYMTLDWQSRVKLPAAITERTGAVQRANITWGASRRTFVIPTLPDSLSVMFGEIGGVEKAFRFGGVAKEAELRPVDVAEIMRCAAISIHRRRWIKGATCKFDPFSITLLDGLANYPGGNGTLLGAWNGVLFGLAQASMEKNDVAAKKLTTSLQFNGRMDHPLTPIALLTLADLRRLAGDNAGAADFSAEATYSAAIFNQYDILSDAMTLGTQVHLMENRSVYPPLEAINQWAGRNDARLPQAASLVRMADCLAEVGEVELCGQAIVQAKKAFSKSGLPLSPEVARIGYLTAVVHFMNGNYDKGHSDLTASIKRFAGGGSRWLYQLAPVRELDKPWQCN